jgi:transcriptional regulator with XRE-family HTH domain
MNRLRELRKQAGLTARQLGESSGFAESTVTAWERSKREIKPRPAGKLLDALKRHGVYATMDVLHGRTV